MDLSAFRTWQLVWVRPGGEEEVIAKGVLAFHLAADGTILYSNGSAIFTLDPSGRAERLVKDSMIEQVAMLETGA